MDKKEIAEISKSLKFNLNEDVILELEDFYSELEKKIDKMKLINTDGVKPMSRIDEVPISFLRDDFVCDSLPKELILKNAPNSDSDFIIINNGGADD